MVPNQSYQRPADFHDLVCRLIDLGYYPVPIPEGCKGPTIPGWQNLRMTKSEVPGYFSQDNMLVGVLHKNNCFIDIDVYDAELSEMIAQEARRRFPGALERVGQYPKTAIVLGLDEVGFKVQNTIRAEIEQDGKSLSAQVEIRTLTRQAVVYGTHPETGERYKWVNGPDLWETPVSSLPVPKKDEIQSFRDWADAAIRDWANIKDSVAQQAQVFSIGMFHKDTYATDERASEEQFLAALNYASASADYDTWVSCLMGIHDFYGGSGAGLSVAQQWSSDYQNYSAREVEAKWRSFEVGKGIGYKSIFHIAKQNGADLSAIARIGSPAAEVEAPSAQAVETDKGGTITGLKIQNSAEFLSNLNPAVYVVDGVLAERRCLSLTGYAGHGKTTLALHLAIQVAIGGSFGGMECEQGSCLVLAGENPDNVKWQYASAIAAAGVGNDIPVHFLPGHFQLSAFLDDLIAKARSIPNLRLVVIDSLQAFFEGENDNGNVEMMEAARRFRRLSEIEAGPAVVVIAHPAGKRPDKTNIVPRGGSSFGNEFDGNLTVWAEPDGTQTFHHTEKFRGAPFEPMTFVMEAREFDHLKDHKGRALRLKISRQQMMTEAMSAAQKSERREHDAIAAIEGNPRITQRALADSLMVSKSTADRIMQNLKDEKLIRRHAKKWVLTDGGKEFFNGE